MDIVTSAKFVFEFDPNNSEHVLWFKRICTVTTNLSVEVNLNPMKITVDDVQPVDWTTTHCCIALKYAKAVLENDAWIPPKQFYKVTGV